MDGRTDGRTGGRAGGRAGGRTGGRTGGRADGRTGGWVDAHESARYILQKRYAIGQEANTDYRPCIE